MIEDTRCRHMGYSFRLSQVRSECLTSEQAVVAHACHGTGIFRLAAVVLLYAPSHRQESTYYGLCYTSRGALAEKRNRKGNVLFNDALNTFYLRLYGVGYMVKDHSDSERGNPLPPHGLLFPISIKGSYICTIPQTG